MLLAGISICCATFTMSSLRPVLFGAMIDVSVSMGDEIGYTNIDEAGQWAKTVLEIIDLIIDQDLNESNLAFVSAFGAHPDNPYPVFDVLATLKNVEAEKQILEMKKQRIIEKYKQNNTEHLRKHAETITTDPFQEATSSDTVRGRQGNDREHLGTCDKIIGILEKAGAPKIRNWVMASQIKDAITFFDAIVIEEKLSNDISLRKTVVSDYLPEECRDHGFFKSLASAIGVRASNDDIVDVRNKIMGEVKR